MNKSSWFKLAALVVIVLVLAAAGQTLLALAINAVTLVAYVILGIALVYILPVLVYALRVGTKRVDSAITVADPINALKVEYEDLVKYVNNQLNVVTKAEGDINHLKKLLAESKGLLTPEREATWVETIQTQTKAIDYAKETIAALNLECRNLKMEIESAKLELTMIDVSNNVSNTLNGGTDRALSERRQEAINAITRRTEQSKSKLNMAMSQLESNRARA